MDNKWITIDSYLPAIGQPIIASLREGCSPRIIILNYDGISEFFTNGMIEAWMPAPNPYVKGEEEEDQGWREIE